MNVCVADNVKPAYQICTGDIVVWGGQGYLITSFRKDNYQTQFVARNMDNGTSGLCGRHATLKDLQKALPVDAVVYPKEDFEFVLRRK